MINRSATTAIFLLSLISGGCASLPQYRPALPDDIGDKGLLVGQVVGVDWLQRWGWSAAVSINDQAMGELVNGTISIALNPGEYRLSGLVDTFGGSSTMYYGGVTVTATQKTNIPVTQKFTIRPKQVTNLGLLVLYPDPNDKERKKFMSLFVDNTADMKHFVKTSYPKLATTLDVDAMLPAPGRMMPDNLLPALRKELAMKEATTVEEGMRGHDIFYVAADLGTLAEVSQGSGGRIAGIRLIDVPTLSNIESKSPNYVKEWFAFVTKSNRLFVVKNGKVTEGRLPSGLRAPKIFVLGPDDLLIIDDKFEIYASNDGGNQWQSFPRLTTDKPVSVNVSPGGKGYYASSSEPPRAFFSVYGKADFQPVDLPRDMQSVALLRETRSGLFAEQSYLLLYSESEPRRFFVRLPGTAIWERRSMPERNCTHIEFQEMGGVDLATGCSGSYSIGVHGPRQRYVSGDSGKTWRKDGTR